MGHPGKKSESQVRMIRCCNADDFDAIGSVINDGAQAYIGVIPADRLSNPYMSKAELRHEIDSGVAFWGLEENVALIGVMGIQPVQDVTLIRHAYVRTGSQKLGIGSRLLSHLLAMAGTPVLIGTWADAGWAIRFYEKHGFTVVGHQQKERLLRRYWTVPERQIETSVVLADRTWKADAIG
jgi:GNAT superfamily N-acetyltransferase